MIVRLAAAALLVALAAPALAQRTASPPPPQQTNPDEQNANQTPTYEEQVVVTASTTEEQLVNAPAVSVVSSETIQNSPATNIGDLNWPPKNRFNTGFNFSYSRYLGNLTVSYTDKAFWQDVLDVRYAGLTDPFTTVNGAFGVRWLGDRLVTSIKMNNIGNEEMQQHIFGDIIKRQVIGEARVTF